MFSRLEYLGTLVLSNNSLSVRTTSTATLPPRVYHLDLSSCDLKEFPQFSRNEDISLDYVDLSNNKIEGEIPQWIGFVGRSTSSYLNLSHNRLTGNLEQIPWNSVQYLHLESNMLNGSLPTLNCNSSFLQVLSLSHNNLSGVLPICPKKLTTLLVFDLRMNNIQGNIPATLSNFCSLETINLNGNKLEGSIPSSFAELDSLQVLDLGSNQINDTFPKCLEALPNLQVRCLQYIGNFKAMMNGEVNNIEVAYMGLDFVNSFYIDSTSLVIKGVEIELVRILNVFTAIDVSRNNFEGEIPEHVGNLVSLRHLNLSHNHLTGHIPFSIGKLLMLESLDLSSNQLEGKIPQQLASIYTLARLNLSCNQLGGHIPQGPQFSTFDNDSYVGNLALCGSPLSRECEQNPETQRKGGVENHFFNGFTWEAVVIGYGCGVVPAFLIGYLMLLAGKPKLYAGTISRELGLKIRRMEIKM